MQTGTEREPDWTREGGRQIIVSQRRTSSSDLEVQLPGHGPGSGSQAQGRGYRGRARLSGGVPPGTSASPLPAAPPETLVHLGKQTPGGLGHSRFCKHSLAAGHSRLQERGIPRRRGRTPTSPGRSPRAAGARPAAPAARRQRAGSRATSPRRARLL